SRLLERPTRGLMWGSRFLLIDSERIYAGCVHGLRTRSSTRLRAESPPKAYIPLLPQPKKRNPHSPHLAGRRTHIKPPGQTRKRAGDRGVEPRVAVLETTVLPIHQSPTQR